MKKSVFLLMAIILISLSGCTENYVSESQIHNFENESLCKDETPYEEGTAFCDGEETPEKIPDRKPETKTYVRSLTDGLSVRSGPGTKYEKAGTPGTWWRIAERKGNGAVLFTVVRQHTFRQDIPN